MTREQIEARIRQLAEARASNMAIINGIVEAASAENRALTVDESTSMNEARASNARIDGEATGLTADLDSMDVAERAQAEADAAAERRGSGAQLGGAVAVGREPLTYERSDVRSSYFLDLARDQMGAGPVNEARARLQRHAAEMRVELPRLEARMIGTSENPHVREVDGEARDGSDRQVGYERRDLSTTDGAGGEFVPPLWMVADFIDLSRGGRVTANLCNGIPLPGGTDSINLPKVNTGTATAIQTADNAAVVETDMTTTSVQGNVKTIAGQQDIALQLLEQSPIAFDEVIFADLAGDHAQKLDVQVINGSNASGQVRGILAIPSLDTTTYTDATPTVAELYPKLADSANQIATTRFRTAEAIIMHPRRWFWMLSQVDSANRPLVAMSEQGLSNALAVANSREAEGSVGMTPFGPVYIDPNVPTNLGGGTNEDRVILTRPSELYLFEGAVRTRVLPEVGSGTLTVRVQLYSYMAFIPHRRPVSTSVIGGTGLVAPTF